MASILVETGKATGKLTSSVLSKVFRLGTSDAKALTQLEKAAEKSGVIVEDASKALKAAEEALGKAKAGTSAHRIAEKKVGFLRRQSEKAAEKELEALASFEEAGTKYLNGEKIGKSAGLAYTTTVGQLTLGAGAVTAVGAAGYALSSGAEKYEPQNVDPEMHALEREQRQLAMTQQILAQQQAYANTFANVNAEAAGMTAGKGANHWQQATGRGAPAISPEAIAKAQAEAAAAAAQR